MIECPAETLSGEGISLGGAESGAALMLKNGTSQASFISRAKDRNVPIYIPTLWRGSFSQDLEGDRIEFCCEDTSGSTKESITSHR